MFKAPATYIRVNGTQVFIDLFGKYPKTVECSSEQCEGCGIDIIETGVYGRGRIKCENCGTSYEVQHTTRVYN